MHLRKGMLDDFWGKEVLSDSLCCKWFLKKQHNTILEFNFQFTTGLPHERQALILFPNHLVAALIFHLL